MKKRLAIGIFGIAFILATSSLFAEGNSESTAKYPSKPITIIVTKSLGGSVDSAVRLFAPFLQNELGVPVIVKNITSAGGRAAAEQVFRAKPDGYTLLGAPLPSAIVGQLMYNSPADFRKLTPIYNIMGTYQTVTVSASSKFDSLAAVLKAGESEKVTMAGSGGMGSNASIVYAELKKLGMSHLVMVPFPGASQAAAAVMGNHTDISSQSSDGVLKYVDNHTLKVLAVAADKRVSFLPNVPTFKELGYNVVVPLTSSIFAPPNMSADKVATLDAAFEKALKNPTLETMRKRLNVSLDPADSQGLAQMVKDNFTLVEQTLPLIKAMSSGQ